MQATKILHHIKRYDSMLFNYETSNRTDFRDGEIVPIIETKYKATKGKRARVEPPPFKDIHALTEWRFPLPFYLFWKPKDILRTNPRNVQEPYGRVEDHERKLVQMTRPRVVMTPASSFDELDDETRTRLIDNMYMTTNVFGTQENVAKAASNDLANVKAPLGDHPEDANPLSLPKLLPPVVSPEWRMESVTWDNKQTRGYCVPSREFWLARRSNCAACKQTAILDARRKLKRKH